MKRYQISALIIVLVIGCIIAIAAIATKKDIVLSGAVVAPVHGFKTTINISPNALRHVIDRHTVDGMNSAGKSVFLNGGNLTQLIKDSGRCSPVQETNGNLQRIVDAGHNIGIDRATGNPTSMYTVITDQSNVLITAFPGLP